jgi:hypothetical protein
VSDCAAAANALHQPSLVNMIAEAIYADVTTRPENETEEIIMHNYYYNTVCIESTVHIRSEHCMGFLKGHWSSLRGLHIHIDDEKGLRYAALWVINQSACILECTVVIERNCT